ncbi:hypothetical protein Pan216_06540 [Planctomycetes bacterium Pan216]|uniref:Uncharacterized protein n=1 Tax=Kolteria novifilia TaxID=2527975 RepID=A0A518AYM0_9BACT|nr:hypothetical protein Pan216_06540 [Planctomycetes bacterium Pan216]
MDNAMHPPNGRSPQTTPPTTFMNDERRPKLTFSAAARRPVRSVPMPVSPGEFIDKISILSLKRDRITSAEQRGHVERELELLEQIHCQLFENRDDLEVLSSELDEINAILWGLEEKLRRFESDGDFGADFVETARRVYLTNDRRADLKRQINELLHSVIIEVKSF